MTDQTKDQLVDIQRRLGRIEEHLSLPTNAAEQTLLTVPTPAQDDAPPPPNGVNTPSRPIPRRPSAPNVTLSTVMAVVAGVALVLAAVYFIRLAFNAGWLTPPIQIGLAMITGIGLVASGVAFARRDTAYAAYLPAVGIIVLFLAIYGAHITYGLIPQLMALAGVAATSLTGLWLSRRFSNSVYGIFSAVGVYLTPLLLPGLQAETMSLVIYFTAWSLLFSFVALTDGRRLIYVVAMFLALLGFDVAWRLSESDAWVLAACYQAAQFLIFAATAAVFSTHHKQPMTAADALAHGTGLLYFYLIEYILLKQNAPTIAPWIALASGVFVLAVYLLAKSRSDVPLAAGGTLVGSYISLVTAHIVFFEFASERYIAMLALLFPALGWLIRSATGDKHLALPTFVVSAAVFAMGFFVAIVQEDQGFVPQGGMLALYAAILYAGFWWSRRKIDLHGATPFLLYAAHLAALIASTALIDNGLLISILWGAVAVALLLYAVRSQDIMLGRSSLIIFLAGALKVLFVDLSDADQLVRVIVLVVLAASLYAGGWLYQKLGKGIEKLHPNDDVNRQLNEIRDLLTVEESIAHVAEVLNGRGVVYLGEGDHWTAEAVERIAQDYDFRRP